MDVLNKKVYLISSPRTYSVCITRVLEQTGLFHIFHEPFVSVYDKINYQSLTENWFKNTAFNTKEEVEERISQAIQSKNVLIKDMAFAICEYIEQDIDMIKEPNTLFILAYRNPTELIHSFYNKLGKAEKESINPDQLSDLIGYEKLCRLYNIISRHTKNVILVNTTELRKSIGVIFDFLQITLRPEYLTWNSCSDEDKINEKSEAWKENKRNNLFLHWHGEALISNGIHDNKKKYNTDENGRPTFLEIFEGDRQNLLGIYDRCNPYYQELETKVNKNT